MWVVNVMLKITDEFSEPLGGIFHFCSCQFCCCSCDPSWNLHCITFSVAYIYIYTADYHSSFDLNWFGFKIKLVAHIWKKNSEFDNINNHDYILLVTIYWFRCWHSLYGKTISRYQLVGWLNDKQLINYWIIVCFVSNSHTALYSLSSNSTGMFHFIIMSDVSSIHLCVQACCEFSDCLEIVTWNTR
jgi:hypothetical protein